MKIKGGRRKEIALCARERGKQNLMPLPSSFFLPLSSCFIEVAHV
jgi:hypothetical protein